MIELEVKEEWVGKSLLQLDLRRKYFVNIVAILQGEEVHINIDPEKALEKTMKLIAIGNVSRLNKVKY